MDAAIFHHLALPPQLPQKEDENLPDIEDGLAQRLITSARKMLTAPRGNPEYQMGAVKAWGSIQLCLTNSQVINKNVALNKQSTREALANLDSHGALAIYVKSQNAALLIHRIHRYAPLFVPSRNLPSLTLSVARPDEEVVIEVFETAARNEDVLAADSALLWEFPGCTIAVPLETFTDEDFQENFTTFLEQASIESTKMFAGQGFKAGITVYEYRDTASPEIVSSLLMGILEQNGRKLSPPRLRKRVRDDVCWLDANRPWRRSPYWLVLRVAVSRLLQLALGEEAGRIEYKICMSVLFTAFLASARASLSPDQVHFLTAKLCRRLVKLDSERQRLQDKDLVAMSSVVLDVLSPAISQVLGDATTQLQTQWETFKQGTQTAIRPLPKRATASDLLLRLRVSGNALRNAKVSTNKMLGTPQPRWVIPENFNPKERTKDQLEDFVQPFLAAMKSKNALRGSVQQPQLASRMRCYLDKALPLYEGHPEQMSLLILDSMEIWVDLDRGMHEKIDLLLDYHPFFTAEMLDVLHLPTYDDMVRLQKVQTYLQTRVQVCSKTPNATNIFVDPSPGCFAQRYYDECPEAEPMRVLREKIEHKARQKQQSIRNEWQRKNSLFEALTRQVNGSMCTNIVDDDDPLKREIHVESRCPRCQAAERLSRLRMRIHEHPLPSDEVMVKAVLFEIMCPIDLSEYRDITWMLAVRLASPDLFAGSQPRSLLREYSELHEFCEGGVSAFTLASSTKSCKIPHLLKACGVTADIFGLGFQFCGRITPQPLSLSNGIVFVCRTD